MYAARAQFAETPSPCMECVYYGSLLSPYRRNEVDTEPHRDVDDRVEGHGAAAALKLAHEPLTDPCSASNLRLRVSKFLAPCSDDTPQVFHVSACRLRRLVVFGVEWASIFFHGRTVVGTFILASAFC